MEYSEFICSTCNKLFSSKQSLEVHKKTAKSCNSDIEKITYDCQYCNKKLSSLQSLKKHLEICIIKKNYQENEKIKLLEITQIQEILEQKIQKYNNDIKNLCDEHKEEITRKDIILTKNIQKYNNDIKNLQDEHKEELSIKDNVIIKLKTIIEQLEYQETQHMNQIEELQDKIERLAGRAIDKKAGNTNTVNNNTVIEIHQPLPSQQEINDIIKNKFDRSHFICGTNGVANFVLKEIITGKNGELLYKCFDSSRKTFHFYNEKMEEVKDSHGYKLIEMIHPAIIDKSIEIKNEDQRQYDELKEKKDKAAKGTSVLNDAEVDKFYSLKNFTETHNNKCLLEIKKMKKEQTFSKELSRLTCVKKINQ